MAVRRLVTDGHYLLQDFTPPLQHFTPPETFGRSGRTTECYPTRDLRVTSGTQLAELGVVDNAGWTLRFWRWNDRCGELE